MPMPTCTLTRVPFLRRGECVTVPTGSTHVPPRLIPVPSLRSPHPTLPARPSARPLDELYYPAKIETMHPENGWCTVTFAGYGNIEFIELTELVSPHLPLSLLSSSTAPFQHNTNTTTPPYRAI